MSEHTVPIGVERCYAAENGNCTPLTVSEKRYRASRMPDGGSSGEDFWLCEHHCRSLERFLATRGYDTHFRRVYAVQTDLGTIKFMTGRNYLPRSLSVDWTGDEELTATIVLALSWLAVLLTILLASSALANWYWQAFGPGFMETAL